MNIYFTKHAIQRIYDRTIKKDDVKNNILKGEIIHEYPDDKPYPSYLSLSIIENNPLHVVFSKVLDEDEELYIVITVYEPSLDEWQYDFKTRRNTK